MEDDKNINEDHNFGSFKIKFNDDNLKIDDNLGESKVFNFIFLNTFLFKKLRVYYFYYIYH